MQKRAFVWREGCFQLNMGRIELNKKGTVRHEGILYTGHEFIVNGRLHFKSFSLDGVEPVSSVSSIKWLTPKSGVGDDRLIVDTALYSKAYLTKIDFFEKLINAIISRNKEQLTKFFKDQYAPEEQLLERSRSILPHRDRRDEPTLSQERLRSRQQADHLMGLAPSPSGGFDWNRSSY